MDYSQVLRFDESTRAMIRLGAKPNLIELLNFLDGAEVEAVLSRGIPAYLGDSPVSIISLPDLFGNKRAVGRP